MNLNLINYTLKNKRFITCCVYGFSTLHTLVVKNIFELFDFLHLFKPLSNFFIILFNLFKIVK